MVPFTRSSEALVALIQGDVDVSGATIDISFLRAVTEVPGLKYVADKGFLDPNGCSYTGWLARNEVIDSGQLEDLGNITEMNIGYGNTNMMSNYMLSVLLETARLTIEDLTVVNIPQSNRLEALRNGAVDIALMAEPGVVQILEAGVAQMWMPVESYLPDAQLAVIWYGPTFTEENREAGRRFMVSYQKAVQQYNEGKMDRNVDLMSEFTQLDAELVRQMCWQAFRDDGSINFQTVQDLQEWAVSENLMDEIVPIEDYWDGEFFEYAREVLD